jgi:electron transfer flavoprotein beta subunit
MRVIALVKHVPDTIEPRLSGDFPDLGGVPRVVNPADLHALEEAIRIKERLGTSVETAVVTMGRPDAESAVRDALAMGIDSGLCIDAPGFDEPGADVVSAARTLAAGINRLGAADLILCGQKSLDQQSGIFPAAVAEALGCGFVPDVGVLELEGTTARLTRLLPSGRAVIELRLPAVVSVLKALNEPRLASLRGLMKAKRAEIPHVPLEELAAGQRPRGPRREAVAFHAPPARAAALMLEGTPAEQARALLGELRRARVL